MTDYEVKQTDTGEWAVYSAFNSALLAGPFNDRTTAVRNARERAWRGKESSNPGAEDPTVVVHRSPKEPEEP